MSIARCRTVVGSLYGLMRNALGLNVATPLESQELSCTVAPDRRLVVLGHEPIAGFARDHGTVADEAAMLALHTLDGTTLLTEPTFVAPGDSCIRTDDPGWRWHCVAGHGTTLADWERRPLGGALEGLATSGHTHPISAVAGLQTALDGLDTAISGKQAVLANAATLARISAAAGGPPKWDGGDWPGGSGGSAWEVSATPPPASVVATMEWASNGDTGGLFYRLGTLAGTAAWENPISRGNLLGLISSGETTVGTFSDREDNGNNYWSGPLPWIAWDLGAASRLRLTDYSLRAANNGGYLPRYWAIEGSNDVAAWSSGGLAAATWTAIDTREDDATLSAALAWGHFAANGDVATGYRFVRMRWTQSIDYGLLNEVELYGQLLAAPSLPATATGWLTDGAGHYMPYWA